jgi:hypothetical protein
MRQGNSSTPRFYRGMRRRQRRSMPSTPSPYPLRAHELSHHGHKGTHLESMEGTSAVTVAAADSEVAAEWPARTSGSSERSVCCSMSPDIPSHTRSQHCWCCHAPRSPPVSLHHRHSRCRYRRPTARRRRRSSSLGSRSASACSPHYRRHWRRTATSPTAPATTHRSSPSRSPPLRPPQRSRSAAPPSWQS